MKTLLKLCLFCFASIALAATAAPALSDREAKALVEKSWNALSWSLPMGKFDVAKDGSQRENTIPEIAYKSYKAYEKFGVIKITRDSAWETTGKARDPAIEAKIDVAVGPAGIKFVDRDNPNRLKGQMGLFTVTSIVKNEEKKIGVNEYRLLMVTHEAKMKSPFAEVSAEMNNGKSMTGKRKAMVLFKWEPFESKWKLVAEDVAEPTTDFTSNFVSSALQAPQ